MCLGLHLASSSGVGVCVGKQLQPHPPTPSYIFGILLTNGNPYHPTTMSIQCQVCNRRFATQRGLAVHLSKTLHPIPGDGHVPTIPNATLIPPPRRNPRRNPRRSSNVTVQLPRSEQDTNQENETVTNYNPQTSFLDAVDEQVAQAVPVNPFISSEPSVLDCLPPIPFVAAGEDLTQAYSTLSEYSIQSILNTKQKVMAKLYSVSDAAGAPKYLVDQLLHTIRSSATQHGFDPLDPSLPQRRTFFKELQLVIGLPPPQEVPISLEGGSSVTVSRNCFPRLLQDHLLSNVYKTLSNLDLPDISSPFSSKPVGQPTYASIIQSYWYRQAYMEHEDELVSGKAILHPLILYMDKTGTDQIMKSSVEPVVCTSAILNQSQRQDTDNWIVLGYLPKLLSKTRGCRDSVPFPKRSTILRNYHRCLAAVLAHLKLMQTMNPVMMFRRGDSIQAMRIICPIVSVNGDNLSQNVLCGKIANTGPSSVRMSRCCLSSYDTCDSVPHKCVRFPTHLEMHLTAAALGCLYGKEDPAYRSSNLDFWSQYRPPPPITNEEKHTLMKKRSILADQLLARSLGSHCLINAFHGMDLGPRSCCINISTAADIMHSFESGILNHVLSILLHPLAESEVVAIDNYVQSLWSSGGGNRSSSSSLFPRVSFNKGFCSLTLLSSSERVGQLFVVALLMNLPAGRSLFANRFSNDFDARREQRSFSAPNQRKRPRADDPHPNVLDDTVTSSSGSSDDTAHDNTDDSSERSPHQETYHGRRPYTPTEQHIILHQLKLSETVDQLKNILPAQHLHQTKTVLDRFMVQSKLFDKLVLLGQQQPPIDVFGDTSPDYILPAQSPSPNAGPLPSQLPQHISELLDSMDNSLDNAVEIHDHREQCTISLVMDQFHELVELMLCFHSFLKYGGKFLGTDLNANIAAYQKNFQRMMTLMTQGLRRSDNTRQFKIQKFVECNHFLAEHLYKGPPACFNTDTGERGLKTWAKKPAVTAQNRGDPTFRKQVAQNYHEAFLLSRAAPSTLDNKQSRENGVFSSDVTLPNNTNVVAYGKSYVYVFQGDTWGFFPAKDAHRTNIRESQQIPFPLPLSKWFNQHLGSWYTGRLEQDAQYKLVIPIFTELWFPSNGDKDGFRLRAHPNYRGGGPWYDCATIDYEYENEFQGSFPVRCACFFQIPGDVPADRLRMSLSFAHSKEILALVQESEYQSESQKNFNSRICSRYTLQSKISTPAGPRHAKLTCITHTCFSGGIYAFDASLGPNHSVPKDPFAKTHLGTGNFEILVVKDRRSEWATSFLTYP